MLVPVFCFFVITYSLLIPPIHHPPICLPTQLQQSHTVQCACNMQTHSPVCCREGRVSAILCLGSGLTLKALSSGGQKSGWLDLLGRLQRNAMVAADSGRIEFP